MSTQPPLEGTDANLPKVGDLLVGKYRIERVLGRGGMGIVFAATHELLCQRVAVKLLLSEAAKSPEAAGRFLNEARAAARIQNENVARVSDVGMLDTGIPYMVMEFLEGNDLSELLASRGRLAVPQAVDYLLQALEAVAQAHTLGIVHRDLKPANLFLARRVDGSSLVKVLDFGISKTTGVLGQASNNTSTQSLLGSPYYMSPEQLRSSKNVDRRTDIWSFGVILYELLAGTHPYEGESLGALFAAILENEPPPLGLLRADAPNGLDAVYKRCLKRNPDERYATCQELAIALAPFCTPRGHASIERITSAGPTSGPASLSSPPVGAITGRGQTAASWGSSGVTPGKKPSRAPAIIAASVVSVALLGGGVLLARVFFASAAPATATARASEADSASAPPSPTASATARTPEPPTPDVAPAAERPPPRAPASAEPAAEAEPPASAAPVESAKPRAPVAAAPKRPKAPPAPPAAPRGYDPSKDTRR